MRYADIHQAWCRSRSAKIYDPVGSLAEADGIRFSCPQCGDGCQILIWTPQAHPGISHPESGRWEMLGSGADDLTLVASSSSVQVDACGAHFFIRDGLVTFA